jgi:hypothetical protein
MDARADRRAPETNRVPLDVLVRLSHEDFAEPFDADGVDVSAGGVSLRSDYLPEVGDRLRCRFDCPPEGQEIEVDGEVVWAHDAGDRSGEFGMRFTELDVAADRALRKLVAHGKRESGRSTVRLHLDRVATPIEAEVLERANGWLTVEQELPFLQIGMGVAVEGIGPAHGRLASVDLRIEDGTPRLLLVVEHASAREEREEPEATLQDFPGPVEEERNAITPRELDTPVVVTAPSIAEAIEGVIETRETQTPALPAWQARVLPIVRKAREHALVMLERAKPALGAMWTQLVLFSIKVASKLGPRGRAIGARMKAFGVAIVAKIAPGKGKRRTTAAPSRSAQAPVKRRQQREEDAPPPKKTLRRIAILSALAFAGVGIAVYAFASEGTPAPRVEERPAPRPAPAPPEPVIAAPPLAPPAPVAPVAAEESPAPAPEAGQLGAPTFPSLSDAPRAEVETPSQAPASSMRFGAVEIPNGRSVSLRMSQPVTGIRGQREPDGFTVTIPGALALDRAGPMRQAIPAIERAMILNRGDHAVLTVRFVAGRNPPYRVTARGSSIEVTVGR